MLLGKSCGGVDLKVFETWSKLSHQARANTTGSVMDLLVVEDILGSFVNFPFFFRSRLDVVSNTFLLEARFLFPC